MAQQSSESECSSDSECDPEYEFMCDLEDEETARLAANAEIEQNILKAIASYKSSGDLGDLEGVFGSYFVIYLLSAATVASDEFLLHVLRRSYDESHEILEKLDFSIEDLVGVLMKCKVDNFTHHQIVALCLHKSIQVSVDILLLLVYYECTKVLFTHPVEPIKFTISFFRVLPTPELLSKPLLSQQLLHAL